MTNSRKYYQRIYQREYRKKHRSKILMQNNNNYNRLRKEVISYYSDKKMYCAKCKIDDLEVLTIDHINNEGSVHRKNMKSSSIYAWLKKSNFPDGFQVLCHNCNWLKERARHLTVKDFLLKQEIGEL